ncbi:CocE/NonD family hydrolase [Bernardetia sp. Wsw4-3y2]|uniref:alpha/beta hydrolase family protein n=1 Tax=Bernardetia sp. Wsw4-3y2 TaxID=3127471 RepID=UPI0030D23ECA
MYCKNLLLALSFFIISTISFAQTTQGLEYLIERKGFQTKLLNEGKAPQPYEKFDENREDIILVNYESEGKKLKGLVETSNIEKDKKKPVLVYLHGGFALGYQDVLDCQPFIDAGFVVFAPTYRGENGNDGNFEFFLGEVDDAKAAINWIAKQEYANADSIFVFGHSIGGTISSLLSLQVDVPINLSASNAGFYTIGDLESFEKEGVKTFDYSNEKESIFRTP